jgi:transposase
MTQPLLPDLPGFSIEQITLADRVITVLAQSQTRRASCAVCASLSSRVHSQYERTLSDLPWSGRTVRLVIRVRRFFCQQLTRPRKTFVEAIPAVAERYARRTIRLKEVLERLALALGGEQSSRLTAVLQMRCSPDTLLRLLRRLPDEPFEPPRVVSLDDWAWRRGHRYGTLICDLERHRRLDLLPDREAASVAAWLKRYPSIEIISRDRSDTYATAARLGAPQALQVADRWHLLKNLSEALQRCFSRHLSTHRKQQLKELLEDPPVLQSKRTPYLSPLQEQTAQLHRAERLARYEQAVALRKQGLSHQAIAERVGVGHSTVQRWIEAGTFPERNRREQASQLDLYLPFIRERWEAGCHNMARIYRELGTKGYKGSYESVRNVIITLRQGDRHAPLRSDPPLSSCQVVWLFLRRSEEQETIA